MRHGPQSRLESLSATDLKHMAKKKKSTPLYTNGQTTPPSKPVDELYPNNEFPKGLVIPYSEERKALLRENSQAFELDARMYDETLNKLRQGAEVHREIRQYARRKAQPGVKLWDFCVDVEERARDLLRSDGKHSGFTGIAFPTGVSLNEVAAHYTPNPGDDTVIQSSDIMKYDIGMHVDGYVIDSACTMHWKPHFDNLSLASKDATTQATRMAGAEVCLSDIGDLVEEIITSYEVTIDGKTYPLQPIRNLFGHTVGKYQVHAGRSIPNCKNSGIHDRMKVGEMYALETFASTGKGLVHDVANGPVGDCSHYMCHGYYVDNPPAIRMQSAKKLFGFLRKQYSTLAWCPRWIERDGQTNWQIGLKNLVDNEVVNAYPPLADVAGSYTSQHEHTFMVLPDSIEILTAGDDY
ncbi:Peptidase M24, methionine aminopeptidase [Carpediemonas membranifera]|uniref:Methionine aminopeptidase 2 n=1 Tax=Carpediemonas membranifera TaxID=201153 RepID=A0A8J6B5A4_9EUKA|nr:Peptidase M24, methionine aminopeptidase [Carpediemonas membranifera]|eukprot:KAG9390327.1 Peptidase M24, methionine aminopeptidase [Carpediemonas membranifera]